MAREHTNQHTIMFPAPLEVWVGSYQIMNIVTLVGRLTFPTPLEAWVGSYTTLSANLAGTTPFPTPLEV